MSIFATLSLPLYSSARASTVGASCLHGPHQTAQKSTSVGTSLFKTSVSKLWSVISLTFALAMVLLCNPWGRRPQPGTICSGNVAPVHLGRSPRLLDRRRSCIARGRSNDVDRAEPRILDDTRRLLRLDKRAGRGPARSGRSREVQATARRHGRRAAVEFGHLQR